MDILTKILDEMKKGKLSQKYITSSLGLSQQAFSEWKAGRTKSYMKYLPQIAAILGVLVDYLLRRDEKAPAPEEPEQEQDAIDAEFADRVSRLSESGREALSHYLNLLLKTEGSSISATVCHTDRISRISEGKARPSARS